MMKTINRIVTFLSLLFLLQLASCMPDSLTKFDEDTVAEDVSGGTVEVVDNSDGTLTSISITQVQGDNIILQVDNSNNFTVGDEINVSSSAAIAVGTNSLGTIIAVTEDDNGAEYLTVTLDSTAAIPSEYFQVGYFVDNCNLGYGACSATSLGAAEIQLVGFYINESSSFSKTFNPIASNTAMDFTYTVSPSLPNSIRVDTNVAGDNTDDAIESPVGPFRIDSDSFSDEPYVFTVSVTNFGLALDETETQNVSVLITGRIPGDATGGATGDNGTRPPTAAGFARYQFLRLSSNSNRFYRGSRISINTNDDNRIVTGRVLMKDDSNGILVEATHLIRENSGIDNTSKFYANETMFEDYVFLYVDSITDMDVNDVITSSSGVSAVIESVDSENNLIYARKIVGGDFAVGESITEDDVTLTTTIVTTFSDRTVVNGVLQVGDASNFAIGSTLSTAAGDTAMVMATDTTANNIFILHLSGTFSDGEAIDNTQTFVASETTINSVIGPIIDITTAGGSNTSSGVDFREGSLVSSSNGATQRGAGFAVAGTDMTSNSLVVQVENFNTGDSFDVGNNLDDYTQTNITLGSPYTVSSVDLSNLVIAYVDEPVDIAPHVRGSFSIVQISPSVLPAGLTLDTSLGRITGTPTEPTSLRDYTVTFSIPGEAPVSYTFPIVVYSQFEITQVTDNGSSYLLHKEGRGLAASRCKIFGPQVIDDPSDAQFGNSILSYNDVYCRLEAGEQDLYKEGIKFNIKSGGGMCEFVQYNPYSFKIVPRESTNATYVRYNNFNDVNTCTSVTTSIDAAPYITPADLTGSQIPTTGRSFDATYCESGGDCIADNTPSSNDNDSGFCRNNHSALTDGTFTYPNADSGSYELVTVTCSVVDSGLGSCNCDATISNVSCGGNSSSAIGGAINDVAAIDKNTSNSIIYPAFNSLLEEIDVVGPINSSASGNYRIANYVRNNACYSSAVGNSYHIEDSVAIGATNFSTTWESFSDVNDPFGGSDLNQFYGFECLNAAGDLKARIRLQVRDWDRTFIPETTGVEELAPATLMDDSTTSCFGSNCNNRNDFDDIIGTNFTTCGTPIAMTADATVDVDLTLGSHLITANGADTFDADNYRRGTKIIVGAGGAQGELHFVVEEYIDSQTLKVTTPSPQEATNLDVQFYDGYRYPLEGF